MDRIKKKLQRRARIRQGIRKKITGTAAQPRLTIYRSNKAIYAQLVDDESGVTLAASSSFNNEELGNKKPVEKAHEVGKSIAQLAVQNNISNVVFDRNGYLYHGRVKALAEGAREGGLKF